MDENVILEIINNNYQQDIINYLTDIIIVTPEELLKNYDADLGNVEKLNLDNDSIKLTDLFIWRDDGNQLEFQLYIKSNFNTDDGRTFNEVKNTLICRADKDEFLNDFNIFDLI